MNAPDGRLYIGCFLRSYLANAAYNLHGLQNIGFFHALDPVLRALYHDEASLREARLRHVRWYNCHPFFTPLYLGIILKIEKDIASGLLEPNGLMALKDTTANALSAIGDSFFNGTLLGAWALTLSCLVLAGHPHAAAVLTAILFAALHLCKLATFFIGARKGLGALLLLKRLNLASWSERFKYGNAALLVCFAWIALPGSPAAEWSLAVTLLLAASWIVGRLHLSRILVALVFFTILTAAHWTTRAFLQ